MVETLTTVLPHASRRRCRATAAAVVLFLLSSLSAWTPPGADAAAVAVVQPPFEPPVGEDAGSTATRSKRRSTAFGSASIKNVTATNVVRECSTDSNCLDTPYTSCAVDPTDRKRRCLCADGKQPLNGDCLRKPRALRTSCETDLECLPNAVCKSNATSANPRLKICSCKDGFTEEKEACNYADFLTFNHATLLITVFTSWIWNDRHA